MPVASTLVSPGEPQPGPMRTVGARWSAEASGRGNQWARMAVPSNEVTSTSEATPATAVATTGGAAGRVHAGRVHGGGGAGAGAASPGAPPEQPEASSIVAAPTPARRPSAVASVRWAGPVGRMAAPLVDTRHAGIFRVR